MSLIDISERKLAEGALRASEERYRELFDESPVPIWDEDWTQIKQMFDDLAESGVTDWRGYFKDHRDQLKAAYDLAEVNEISLAACTLYRASSKEELEQTTTAALAIDEELDAFCEIALAFLAGEMTVEVEAKDRAVDGSYIFVRRRVVIPPNYRHDWSRVLYAIEDITEHTRSQAALAESEASLAEAQEIANSGSWVESHVGEQQITERWSAQLCRIFGIERDAAPQGFDAYLNYVHAEDRERVARTRSSAIEIGEHYEMEYRIVRPDGEVRSILSKSRPFKDEARNVRRIAGSITDVTERRRLEEAARERDERYQALFDNAGIGIALSNAEGQILESNPAVQNMFGYTARELKSLTIAELTHPDDVEESKKLRGAMVAGDSQTYQMDKRYVGKDGRTIWGRVTSRPVHNSAGEFRFSAAMIEDISERNAADEALAESELRLQMITDNLPAFVAYVDANGYYRFANKFYEDWFGRPTDELIGSHIEDVIGSGNFAAISESFHKVLRGEQIASIGNIRSHDGRNGHFFANYVPDHGPDGTVRGYYVLSQDITEMKRVEDELRRSEDCLNLAQRIAHIGNFEHHFVADHYFDDELNWSDETCRIFGLDPERDTATPELLISLIHPDDKDKTIAAYDKAMAGEGKYSCDYRLLLANGEIRHAHERGEVAFDSAGRPVRSFGTVQDITELKRAENELRESEQELRAIYDTAAVGIALTDSDGNLLRTKLAFQHMLGQSGEELKVTPFTELTHTDDIEADLELFHQVLAGTLDGYQLDKRFLDSSGKPVWTRMHVAGLKNDQGETDATIATVADITESKRAEDALKESEADLARAQEISHLGSWTWDVAADINHWSAEHYRIFGLDPGGPAVNYDKFLSMVHEEDREAVNSALEDALQSLRPYDVEYRLVRADGEIRFAHSIGEVELDDSGRPIRMTGTVQDVTDHNEVEEQLRQAQKMEAIGQLTGGIAHDFNNLLAVMLGNLELIRERVEADGATNEMIDRGVTAAERGAALTHRLLAFSRKQTLLPTAVDLNKLVSGMTDLLRRALGETIEISAQGADGLWLCHVDQAQLENALLNLSINARDAMADGGRLDIETANISLSDGIAAAPADVDPGNYVVLGVSDTGSGIASETLQHVFEPFFTTKEVGKGTGMGLSMVYGFAKQSSGTVTIKSEPDEGTTVKLYLPRSAALIDEADPNGAAAEIPMAQDERVLIVEDDEDVRAMAIDMLSDLGYEIADVGTAEAALEVMETSAPIDLLLSDVVLPGVMNGPDLAAEVRRRSPATKIVYMTGYAEEAFNNYSELVEPMNVIQKPFKRASLAKIIRRVLDEGKLRA